MAKELPIWGKIVYGVPQAGFFLISHIVTAWLFYYYTTGGIGGKPLVAPAVVGLIFLLGRLVDAFADPIIAHYSDKHDSPRGRRIPFMTVSGVLMVACFIAMFHPVIQGQSVWNTVYLAVIIAVFFVAFTSYVCPYLALMPELARTTADRVNLSTYKAVFGMIGSGLALIGAGFVIDRFGFQSMSWIMGLTALALLYIPILLIREKDYADSKPATLSLIDAMKSTLQNRPFVFYLVGCISFWFGGNIVLQSAPFYVTVLMEQSERSASMFYGTAGAVAVLAFPLINYLSKKWGLKAMMMLSMLILTLLLPLVFFMGNSFLGISPITIALIGMGIAGIPIASLFIVPDALIASIADVDEKNTGQRREAMYYGGQGLIMKAALGLSTLLMGTLLQAFGKTPEQPLGVQLTGPVAAFFVLIGLIIFSRFPEKEVTACQVGQGDRALVPK